MWWGRGAAFEALLGVVLLHDSIKRQRLDLMSKTLFKADRHQYLQIAYAFVDDPESSVYAWLYRGIQNLHYAWVLVDLTIS